MMNDWDGRTCEVCSKGFTEEEWYDKHDMHNKGCGFGPNGFCDCDRPVHEQCCPLCNEK